MSSLKRYVVRNLPRMLSKADGFGSGPQGRINRMRKLVTALVRHERIEGRSPYLDEAQGYMEQLLHYSEKYGDCHQPTMELADYWLLEKDLIPKLFKVLVPRFTNVEGTRTQIFRLPTEFKPWPRSSAILELKGNPWPPVVPQERNISHSLVNILLEEARKDYRKPKTIQNTVSQDKLTSSTN